MTLTLVLPGLLWPRQVMRDTLYDTDFPALQTLLGKGRHCKSVAMSADAWWCARLGIRPDEFAAAPLRLAALGSDPDQSTWLCADPVHLQINQRGAVLQDPALLDLTADEAGQLHATLAPLFAEAGELVMTAPAQWHLRLKTDAPAFPARLHDCIEHSATDLLPAEDESRSWRQLINEVQMTLHAHPVNKTSAADRKPGVNSIALWGGGRMPSMPAQSAGIMHSADPVIAGMGKLAGLSVSSLPSRFAASGTDCLAHWDRLQSPTARHDALAWREALEHLEHDWLAPALSALASGVLKRIELHGFGAKEGISIAMSSLDRYGFWRKPRRLESL